ncbi:TorF family putative porin [Novosphingobium album (ex Hu et al. 2023)]|uniref:TorF family putative porin n=1 Tax=Novosphingobium album (ex Hu et al. 2023) TaxID=2930093 RepID=A0ABT0AXC6_9SPHN|nr:TorF family putative porin [Novosphingobium album (ex Hu et al. 2023)]MCJ2177273.1 TorF family putative porin [Novosphingobium album (ex Hu et al. 2023)]
MTMSVRGAIAATLLAGTALAATPAFADEADAPAAITISGNVALTTDYRFRGVSLSSGDPAIQGGITVAHESGLYVSTWSSSINGGDVYGQQELDILAGWSGEVTSGLTLDAGLLYYVYPSGHVGDANYWEPYASLSGDIGPATVKVGVAYDWKQKGLGHDDNLYLYGNVDVAIPDTPLTVSGHIGYTDGVLAPEFLNGLDDRTGWDWSIGASATVFGPLSVSVSYIGVTGPSVDGFTDDTVVGTLTASF